MKDLPTHLPGGSSSPAICRARTRATPSIAATARPSSTCRAGAVVGTASLRRAAQVLRLRPTSRIVLLRGNVETRLRKLESGEVDATLLAIAGLKRLGLADAATACCRSKRCCPPSARARSA